MTRLLSACGLLLLGCGPAQPPALQPVDRPRLVLISIDGFRWDYLDRPPAVRLRALAATGVRVERLVPVFPTKTFPNHYTIVTGLYPEHHGIVANTMVDRAIGRFTVADTAAVGDRRWWDAGEPIWVTAIEQGHRAAIMFWPGSEAPIHGVRPTYWHRFDPRTPNVDRFNQLLAWIDLPKDSAPAFLALYLNELDLMAHRHGPDGPEADSALAHVDWAIGQFVDSLASRHLTDQINLIVLSDHGMTPSPPDRMIYLDDAVDPSWIELADVGPVTTLDAKPGREAIVVDRLRAVRHLSVFRRNEVPARFRFRRNQRIASIVLLADEGWTITSHQRRPYTDLGNHGYDPSLPSMGAILIATGPDFKANAVVPPFQSVHLYDLMVFLLGLKPAHNDGSLDSVRSLLRVP